MLFVLLFLILGIFGGQYVLNDIVPLFVLIFLIVLLIFMRTKYYPAFLLIFVFTLGFMTSINSSTNKHRELTQDTNQVTGYITETKKYENFSKSYLRTTKINGENINLKILLLSYGEDSFSYGDVISFESTFIPLEHNEYNEFYNERSKGVMYKTYVTNYEKIGERFDIHFIKERMNINFYKYLSKENARIVSTVLLGSNLIDNGTRDVYNSSGLSHFLSISGLHIGIIAGILIWILNFFIPKNQDFKYGKYNIIIIALLFFYAFITGFNVATLRAFIMLSIYLLSPIFYREKDSLNSLYVAAFILLLVEPFFIYTIGFILSFTCTLGICLFSKPIKSYIMDLPFSLNDSLAGIVSLLLSIYILVVPMLLYFFGSISIFSFFVNMILFPLFPFVIIFSITTGLFGFGYKILSLVLYIINGVSSYFHSLPFNVIHLNIELNTLILYYIGLYILIKIFFKMKEV